MVPHRISQPPIEDTRPSGPDVEGPDLASADPPGSHRCFGSFRFLRPALFIWRLCLLATFVAGVSVLIWAIVHLLFAGAEWFIWLAWIGGIVAATMLSLALIGFVGPWVLAWLIVLPLKSLSKNTNGPGGRRP